MMWNIVTILFVFEVFTKTCAGLNFEDIWRLNEIILNKPVTRKPDFHNQGVRISEAKCREYIWEIKEDEKNVQRKSQYNQAYGIFAAVISGRDAVPGEFPHMGAVGWKAKKGQWVFLCGSSLISEEFLLTAAHCYIVGPEVKTVEDPSPKIVRLGVENIVKDQRSPLDIKILKFIKHPNYRGTLYKYFDVALIQLRERVRFNNYVRPACIRNQDLTRAIVTGWGVVDRKVNSVHTSAKLQVAYVNTVKSKRCDRKLEQKKSRAYWTGVQDYQICATALNGTEDTCKGDSGGPLQVKMATNTKTPLYNVIGVTSFGFVCGSPSYPSVYTRAYSFVDWIEEVVWTTAKPVTEVKVKERKTIVQLLFEYILKILFS